MRIKDRLDDLLTRQPYPPTAFQLAVPALTGLHAEKRDRGGSRSVVLSLRPGTLEPSFDRPNIKDPGHLADRLADAFKKMGVRDGAVSLLVPESCLKSSVLSFDALPASPAERRNLVLWRLRKQMPSLPEDVRLAYDVLSAAAPWRVFVSAIHPSVRAEYEGLFARAGSPVRNIGLPTLSLAAVLPAGGPATGILANLEEDGLSLLALVDSEVVFYRSKPFLAESREARSPARKMENIAREILNTVTFLEDKEKRKVERLWVRAALADGGEDPVEALKSLVPLSVSTIEPGGLPGTRTKEARLLAPLVGQMP
jgi:hypothetical protein